MGPGASPRRFTERTDRELVKMHNPGYDRWLVSQFLGCMSSSNNHWMRIIAEQSSSWSHMIRMSIDMVEICVPRWFMMSFQSPPANKWCFVLKCYWSLISTIRRVFELYPFHCLFWIFSCVNGETSVWLTQVSTG